ncbi:MAG: 3-hydroxyisobutyrate dehydrogenase, partial [Actinomycetota bacterium]|nr:3-hydroxyisobutyrate dehydrogenase [Actinomycetota bacterium]
MAKIGFLGLGMMGAPIASRLLDAGNDVTVWNRTAKKAQPLVDRGASLADSPAEAGLGADVTITMVANPEALEQVLFGHEGLATSLHAGQTLIDMSTVGPDAIGDVISRLPADVGFADAPVRGSVPEATAGRLAIFVGATDAAYPQVAELLEPLGSIRHVGAPGSGAAMKLVVNSTLGTAIAGVGEALSLGEALGLERGQLLDVLEETPLGAAVKAKRSNIESGSYPANFKLALAGKDMRLVTNAGERRGRELKVASAALDWFERATDA